MAKFEHKDYFDSNFCFYGDEDKVITIIENYEKGLTDLSDINRIFELYHTKLFFDKVQCIPNGASDIINTKKKLRGLIALYTIISSK